MLEILLITSIVIVGAHIAADELSYTFTDGVKGIGDLLPNKWFKPVITCPTCMASLWGIASVIIHGLTIFEAVPLILALAFTNTLLNKWVN